MVKVVHNLALIVMERKEDLLVVDMVEMVEMQNNHQKMERMEMLVVENGKMAHQKDLVVLLVEMVLRFVGQVVSQ